MAALLVDLVSFLSEASWLVFILAGVVSTLTFFERVATLLEKEEMAEWLKFLAYFGFGFGILMLVVTAANFIGPYITPPTDGPQVGWDVLLLGLVTGAALALKPIKDMRWASLIALTAGALLMVAIWFFVGPSGVAWPLIAVVIVLMFILYLALKFVEDLYTLISAVLTSPPVAVGLGVVCIVEGFLLLFGTSFLSLIPLF